MFTILIGLWLTHHNDGKDLCNDHVVSERTITPELHSIHAGSNLVRLGNVGCPGDAVIVVVLFGSFESLLLGNGTVNWGLLFITMTLWLKYVNRQFKESNVLSLYLQLSCRWRWRTPRLRLEYCSSPWLLHPTLPLSLTSPLQDLEGVRVSGYNLIKL